MPWVSLPLKGSAVDIDYFVNATIACHLQTAEYVGMGAYRNGQMVGLGIAMFISLQESWAGGGGFS